MSGIPAGAGSLLGKRLGKYEILALLALGGTAEIYLARIGGAAGFEKYVVVKCLHDHLADDTEFVKMFLDEARLAAHLDHSNIVQTMELGEHESRYYMVMEFLAGLSLAMIVRRAAERVQSGKIPVPLVLNILAQAAAGLHYAHEKAMNGKPLNIVHRDISPQNLVVSFEGVVKVVDFGIAKAELRETRTRSGTIKGKFAYMSPEQCVANNVDRRTDVFALGVIGHELLTGRRLFKKPSPYETYQAVIECSVEPPSKLNHEVDPALDPLILKAVAKEKENRYQTAEAFGDALLGYMHQRGKGSGPGEVSRFFDASFGQEIEEHGARMRELIAGRDFSVDTGVSWGDGDQPDDKRNQTVDLSGRGSAMSLDTGDLVEQRGSAPSLNSALDELGSGRDDDDEMPAEKTRIESNPLERLQELDKAAAATAAQKQKTPPPALMPTQLASVDPGKQQKMPPSGALPLPPAPVPPGKSGQGTGPGTGKTPAPSVSPSVPVGRFPELANLPTMIAEPDPDDDGLGNSAAETVAFVDPHGPTNMSMEPVVMPNGAPTAQQVAQRPPLPHQIAPTQALPPSPPLQPGRMPQPSSPPANMMAGYPVMDREMSAQIATGATVFPTDRQSSPSHPPPYVPQPQLPMQPPQFPTNGPHNPQQLADLASPVGQRYDGQVDWAAAAAAPAKALPPWMLAVVFIAAIGLALTITIIIAKIAR